MTDQQRTPSGVPTGGQFSGTAHDESDVSLEAATPIDAYDSEAVLTIDEYDSDETCEDCGKPYTSDEYGCPGHPDADIDEIIGRPQIRREPSEVRSIRIEDMKVGDQVKSDMFVARCEHHGSSVEVEFTDFNGNDLPRQADTFHKDTWIVYDVPLDAPIRHRTLEACDAKVGDRVWPNMFVGTISTNNTRTEITFVDRNGHPDIVFNGPPDHLITYGEPDRHENPDSDKPPRTYAEEINDRLVRLHRTASRADIAGVWEEARLQFDSDSSIGEINEGDQGEMAGVLACLENALDLQSEQA